MVELTVLSSYAGKESELDKGNKDEVGGVAGRPRLQVLAQPAIDPFQKDRHAKLPFSRRTYIVHVQRTAHHIDYITNGDISGRCTFSSNAGCR
jgi:hypothetical protein